MITSFVGKCHESEEKENWDLTTRAGRWILGGRIRGEWEGWKTEGGRMSQTNGTAERLGRGKRGWRHAGWSGKRWRWIGGRDGEDVGWDVECLEERRGGERKDDGGFAGPWGEVDAGWHKVLWRRVKLVMVEGGQGKDTMDGGMKRKRGSESWGDMAPPGKH